MKICAVIFFVIFIMCFSSTPLAFAQKSITPTPTQSSEVPTQSGSSILSSFISGFDWISSGLIFYTPSLMDATVKLQDGTELTGMSNFRNIFYDIAVPLFVLITSFVGIDLPVETGCPAFAGKVTSSDQSGKVIPIPRSLVDIAFTQ